MKLSATAPSKPPATAEDNPSPPPPSDPPDSAVMAKKPEFQSQGYKKNLVNNNTMVITNDEVAMIATPELLYKVIRVVNHFVEHIVTHYEDEDQDVSKQSLWYLRWKNQYPFIKSSRRSMVETHRLVHDDYITKDKEITVYQFFMQLLNIIPHLNMCYDILPIDEKGTIKSNEFKLIITLYHGRIADPNNPYSKLESDASTKSYRGFPASTSITTWRTNVSKTSQESTALPPTVPSDVVVNKDSPSIQSDGTPDTNTSKAKSKDPNLQPDESPNSKPSGITDDSNLTYSPALQAPQAPSKNVRFTRNQQMIKEEIINDCRKRIDESMKGLHSSLESLLLDQTNLIRQQTQIGNPPNLHPSQQQTPVVNQQNHPGSALPPTPVVSHRRRNQISPTLPSRQFNPTHQSNTNPRYQGNQSSTFTSSYQRSGSMIFRYQNTDYELRDQQYNKNSSELREVTTKTDLVHFYEEMQSDAISYNIFLQQFDMLKPWAKYTTNTLPPTCLLTHLTAVDNTIDAYNRMKNALYNKLAKSTFHDKEYDAIVKHGSIGKDGFEVLYELMTHCHPKLLVATAKIRDTNKRPELTSLDSVYSYCEKLTTWLTIESIKGLQHSDDQVLDIIMEEMRRDEKYGKAIKSITSELAIKDTFHRMSGTSTFPENLKIYHLPSTIMSYYTKEEREDLFPTDNNSDAVVNKVMVDEPLNTSEMGSEMQELVQAIVKAMKDSTSKGTRITRERVDEMCEGCGMWGHNVYQTGCDRCAQYLMIKKYLEDNPQNIKSILYKYKKHQKNIATKRQNKSSTEDKKVPNRRYNTRYSKARVKRLQDAIFQAMVSDSEETDEESFASATQSNSEDGDNE